MVVVKKVDGIDGAEELVWYRRRGVNSCGGESSCEYDSLCALARRRKISTT